MYLIIYSPFRIILFVHLIISRLYVLCFVVMACGVDGGKGVDASARWQLCQTTKPSPRFMDSMSVFRQLLCWQRSLTVWVRDWKSCFVEIFHEKRDINYFLIMFEGGAAMATLISFSQLSYEKKNLIGYGSFSKVYKGKFKTKECAVKLVFTMDLTEEDICRVAAEATILSSVKSNNVVEIFGVTVLPPSVCIVLELCAYGSLSDVLRPPKALTLSFQDQLYLCLGCAR